MTEDKKRFIENHFRVIFRDAIEIGDENLIEIIENVMSLIRRNDLESAREMVPEVYYSDMQIKFYIVIAGITKEERDIKILRKMAGKHIERFGDVQIGLLIYIAMISGDEFDIKRARRAAEKNTTPFAMVQQFIILYMYFGNKEDLASARASAEIEVKGYPYYKTAGLTLVAGFTGKAEDFIKMDRALANVSESDLRLRVPADININKILDESVDFSSAVDAVGDIEDEYLRAKVWTLMGFGKAKIFTSVTIIN